MKLSLNYGTSGKEFASIPPANFARNNRSKNQKMSFTKLNDDTILVKNV